MFLTNSEERILNGEEGEVLAMAMRLLVTLGEVEEASRLFPIHRSHVAGVSYNTVGDTTLQLLESLVSAKVLVKTAAMQNPAGMDLDRWAEMGVSESFAVKQRRICSAYEAIGISSACTCTPYLCGNKPRFGEVIGFSESSAVAYTNSVLGARSNRHGGLDALAAALVGKVPLMGYLLDENRLGDVQVNINCPLRSEADYGVLGYFVGKNVGLNKIPVYSKFAATKDELKILGAASAASGSVALYHVKGVTPEALRIRSIFKGGKPSETLTFDEESRRSVYEELSSQDSCDLVALGCPHTSLEEVKMIAYHIRGKDVKDGIRLWVFTSPKVYDEARKRGYLEDIKAAGGDIFKHTCMVVAPLQDMGVSGVTTNSAKAALYIPRMTKNKCSVHLCSLRDCITIATG